MMNDNELKANLGRKRLKSKEVGQILNLSRTRKMQKMSIECRRVYWGLEEELFLRQLASDKYWNKRARCDYELITFLIV